MGLDGAWTATRQAARAVSSAAQSGGRAGAGAARRTSRMVHRMTGASGAGRTGLASLIELTAAGGAGDAFVTIALAGTLFFSTSLDQARGRIALTLHHHHGAVRRPGPPDRADAGPGAAGPPVPAGGHADGPRPAVLGDGRRGAAQRRGGTPARRVRGAGAAEGLRGDQDLGHAPAAAQGDHAGHGERAHRHGLADRLHHRRAGRRRHRLRGRRRRQRRGLGAAHRDPGLHRRHRAEFPGARPCGLLRP